MFTNLVKKIQNVLTEFCANKERSAIIIKQGRLQEVKKPKENIKTEDKKSFMPNYVYR